MKTIQILSEKYRYSVGKLCYELNASPRSVYGWLSGRGNPLPIFEDRMRKLLDKEKRREIKEIKTLNS